MCVVLGMTKGKDGFLVDGDVELAKKRLSLIDVYLNHLNEKARAHGGKKFVVCNCTGRQKRLVAYYKIYRHIFGKGEYGKRRSLPACTCILLRQWFPDDDADVEYQGQLEDGSAAYGLDDLLAD